MCFAQERHANYSHTTCDQRLTRLQTRRICPANSAVLHRKYAVFTSQIRRIYILVCTRSRAAPLSTCSQQRANGMAGDTGRVRGCRGMARAYRSRACAARRVRPATLRRREEDAPLMHILFLVSKLICCGVLFLHRCAVLFRDARLLAGELAQVVQLCAAHLADLVDRDAFDVRALDGEDTLNAGCP